MLYLGGEHLLHFIWQAVKLSEGKCIAKNQCSQREKAGGGKREEENKAQPKPVFFPNPGFSVCTEWAAE